MLIKQFVKFFVGNTTIFHYYYAASFYFFSLFAIWVGVWLGFYELEGTFPFAIQEKKCRKYLGAGLFYYAGSKMVFIYFFPAGNGLSASG
jgi:hypothetical protein